MPIHLYNLLLRSFIAIPTSLGATWLGLFFPLWGFLLTQIVILVADGVPAMRSHWRQNLIRGFAVAGVAWASLFLWCAVTTTYNDHMDLAKRTQTLHRLLGESEQRERDSVQTVRSEFGSQVSSLKENCAKIEGANGALVKQTTDQQGTINNCQTQALKLLAPDPMKVTPIVLEPPTGSGIGVHNMKWLVLVNRTITPINLAVVCQRGFESGQASIAGSGTRIGGASKVTDTQYQVNISSPAWGPQSPLIFEMSYYGSEDNACSFVPR